MAILSYLNAKNQKYVLKYFKPEFSFLINSHEDIIN